MRLLRFAVPAVESCNESAIAGLVAQMPTREEPECGAALRVLDAFDVAVMLVSGEGALRWVSRGAHHLLADLDPMEVKKAISQQRSSWEPTAVTLKAAKSGNTIGLVIRPAGNGLRSKYVFLISLDARVSPRADSLRRAYGLTPAEVVFSDEFLACCDVRETALRLGITEQTARFNLKTIFRKTGVRKQAQLVRLLLSLPNLTSL